MVWATYFILNSHPMPCISLAVYDYVCTFTKVFFLKIFKRSNCSLIAV